MTMEELGTAHSGKIAAPGHDKKVALKTAFLSSYNTKKARTMTYVPTSEDTPIITASDGAKLANAYVPPPWAETNIEPTVFLEHIEYLIPDETEREYFLGWVAHKVQKPAERGVGVVMIARQTFGTGRSWLGNALAKMLPNQVRNIRLEQMTGGNSGGASTYNDLMVAKQFVVTDETKAEDAKANYKAYEMLKQFVDTSPVDQRVNPKYGANYEAQLVFNFLAFSNNTDALNIPVNDRRFCILSNPTYVRDEEYYTRLYAELDRPGFAAELYWYFKRYDYSGINPRKPIKTKARQTMVEYTQSDADRVLETIREDETKNNFMTRDKLHDHVRLEANYEVSEQAISHMVKELWAEMHDAPWRADEMDVRFRPRIEGKPEQVKAWIKDIDWPLKSADWGEILRNKQYDDLADL